MLLLSVAFFQFIHYILHHTISFWFFFITSISLLNFSFCLCIVLLISLNCVSVFSCSSLSFFKTAILNYLLGNLQSSMFWGSITRKLLWPFCDVIFIWIFIFLEVLNCYLHILSNNHLLWSLLTDFGKELPSFSSTRVLRFFQPLFGYICFTLLAPSCGRIVKLLCFYSILLLNRPVTDSFPFAFLKVMLNAQVCGLFVAHRFSSPFCTCLLAVCQNLLLLPSEAHTGKLIMGWGSVYMWCTVCYGCPWAGCGYPQVRHISSLWLRQIYSPLIPFEIWLMFS